MNTMVEHFKTLKDNNLKWTKELPTKEGWYWFKDKNASCVVNVEISKTNNTVWIFSVGNDDVEKAINKEHPNASWIGEWYGPIEPPK